MLRGSSVAAALVACAPLLAGCPTTQCQSVTTQFEGGLFVDLHDGTYAYETSSLQSMSKTDTWVRFHGEETLQVVYPDGIRQALVDYPCVGNIEAFLGTSDAPNEDDGAVFVPNAGQTAQFTAVSNKGFSVTNGSCADYSARFFISYYAADDGGGCGVVLQRASGDASRDAFADTSDGGAPSDGGTD